MREVTIWIFKESGKWYTEEKVEIPDDIVSYPYQIVEYMQNSYHSYPSMNIVIPMEEDFIEHGYPCMIPWNKRQ